MGKYHLDFEFCIVELLPLNIFGNKQVYRMIFTGLANFAMPLVRYDIGDYCIISEDTCDCGRKSLIIDRIEGRTEDYIYTPEGNIVIGMNQVFEWASGILEAQIRQEKIEEITVLLVPGEEYCNQDEKILEMELRKRLGNKIKIKFKLVKYIPRAKNEKFRLVVSNIKPKTEEERILNKTVKFGSFD